MSVGDAVVRADSIALVSLGRFPQANHKTKIYSFTNCRLTKDRPDLSSERAPHMDRTVTFNENKYLVMSPRRGSTPRQTD
jgi:hypothetical protein